MTQDAVLPGQPGEELPGNFVTSQQSIDEEITELNSSLHLKHCDNKIYKIDLMNECSNDAVVEFVLDESFDYDNVKPTPKYSFCAMLQANEATKEAR